MEINCILLLLLSVKLFLQNCLCFMCTLHWHVSNCLHLVFLFVRQIKKIIILLKTKNTLACQSILIRITNMYTVYWHNSPDSYLKQHIGGWRNVGLCRQFNQSITFTGISPNLVICTQEYFLVAVQEKENERLLRKETARGWGVCWFLFWQRTTFTQKTIV